MNSALFASLLTIAAAPVVDAPMAITVTPKGRQTLRAHNAPVPTVRRRTPVATTPGTFCGLCGAPVNGADDCPCDPDICIEVTRY